jgi:deoxyribodipyrimidine photolyase
MTLLSCSRQSTTGPEDLRSNLTSAISIAVEAETFIDFIEQHRATHQFAKAHFQYLAQQVQSASEELHAPSSNSPLAQAIQGTQSQLTSFTNELTAEGNHIADPDALAAGRGRIRNIRQTLEQMKLSL